jgi:alcohol dehydrogenase (cytochrome c)
MIFASLLLLLLQNSGKQEFADRCAACHGADGRGGERGPAIVLRGRSDQDLRDLIRRGIPAAGMPGFEIAEQRLQPLVAFVRSVGEPAEDTAVSFELRNRRTVSFADIIEPKPGDWPTYHGRLSGNRHSAIDQINSGNVTGLAPKWMFPIAGSQRLQVTPVVVDGVMYVTAVNEAYALDARNGRQIWRYRRLRSKGLVGDAAGGINRGVAILGDRLFMVTDNAHLIALDRITGRLLWDVEMADSKQNYGATSAPLVVKDLVISGTSGGDEGVRGFLAAYKVSTGDRVWRFWTVPAPGDPEAKTWGGKAIEHGCVTTWLTGTYDPETGLLYWTTGNPCPDYNGAERKGDNLYSDSVLALEPESGKLRWYYQYTPHDLHDWDATQTAMLLNAPFGGRERKLLAQASRNGFFYVLDRTNGELLLAKPFVRNLTWASGVGADGRPQIQTSAIPTSEGVKACPAVEGATNWMSTAFNPGTGLFYVMALEKCNIFLQSSAVWEAGKSYYGGDTRGVPGEKGKKYLRALDLASGKTVWEHPQIGPANSWGGVLSTAGGLVFFGSDDGTFSATDARTGKLLWSFPANVLWKASPMTYLVDGKQYVAIAAGPNIVAFGLP